MSLAREATLTYPGFKIGDVKIAHYAITYTAGVATAPSQDPNWLLLNGASISTSTYPLLFALIGYSYGGSGANFTLPDLTEGRMPITKGLTNFTTLAATGGEINHTLSLTEFPSHSHGQTFSWAASSHGHTVSVGLSSGDDVHSHSLGQPVASGQTIQKQGTGSSNVYSSTTGATTPGVSATHPHSGSLSVNANTSGITLNGGVQNAGSGGAHNNMQPYVVIGGWLVRAG